MRRRPGRRRRALRVGVRDGPGLAGLGRGAAPVSTTWHCVGLDRAIIMGYYWQKHEMCVARNSEALELVRRWPGPPAGLCDGAAQGGTGRAG